MSSSNCREAYVTLVLDDVYSKGARVLGQSLRIHGTTRELVVLISPLVSDAARATLTAVFDHVICVDILDSKDEAHLALLKRPELGVTFTKLHCWSLTDYDKCVFMDADTLTLVNIDELFDKEELSAAPDAGWPDMFNSGVFVFRPSRDTYLKLIDLAATEGSFDGGDQGLLNTYFSSWATRDIHKHLSFLYNMHSTATYTYSPAFARFGKDTKVVHFIGAVKPWHHNYDRQNDVLYQADGEGIHEEAFIKTWWRMYWQCEDQFNGDLHSSLREGSKHHQWMWQTSQVDFTGEDKFDNLQAKMDALLQPQQSTPAPRSPSVLSPPSILRKSSSEENIMAVELEEAAVPEEISEKTEKNAADLIHFELWQRGSTDIQGKDSFKHIQAKIDKTLNMVDKPPISDIVVNKKKKSQLTTKSDRMATGDKDASISPHTAVVVSPPAEGEIPKVTVTSPVIAKTEETIPSEIESVEIVDVPSLKKPSKAT